MEVRSSVFLLMVVIAASATVGSTWAQKEAARQPCRLHSGRVGRCVEIRSCPSVLKTYLQGGPTVKCGFEDRIPVVCCPVSSTDGVTEGPDSGLKDISEPDGYSTLNCGRNAKREIPSNSSFPSPDGSVEGNTESKRDAWPWMALLAIRDERGTNWLCSGILINDQWILSDSYYYWKYNAAINVARLGEYDYYDDFDGADHEEFEVAETIFYPGSTYPEPYQNLALLRLATKVTLKKFVSPVCLAWGRETRTNLTGKKVTKTGWGQTIKDSYPNTIMEQIKLTVYSTSECNQNYTNLGSSSPIWPQGIKEETVCAGDPDTSINTCQGDSGRPIVYLNSDERYTVAGIESPAYGCDHSDYPGLFTSLLFPPHLAWIKKVAFQN